MAQYKTFSTMASDTKSKAASAFPEVMSISSLKNRNEVISNNSAVVIYYYAEWCTPCTNFSNNYKEIAHNYANKGLVLVKEDVDLEIDNKPVDITAVPCFHFYKNGVFQEKMTLTGAEKDTFLEKLQLLI